MAEVKWIKITTSMFDDEKIKLIEKLPDADSILIIWIKLLSQAGKCNAGGYIFLTKNIPYTEEMLATVFDRPIHTVRLALETFTRFGMLEQNECGLYLSNWEKYQNIEGLERIKKQTKNRVAKHREKQKLLPSNVTVTFGNATDIDKNKNKNIINLKRETFKKPNVEEIKSYCSERKNSVDPEAFFDFYEAKGWMVGKNRMKDWKAAVRTWEKNTKSIEKGACDDYHLPG